MEGGRGSKDLVKSQTKYNKDIPTQPKKQTKKKKETSSLSLSLNVTSDHFDHISSSFPDEKNPLNCIVKTLSMVTDGRPDVVLDLSGTCTLLLPFQTPILEPEIECGPNAQSSDTEENF